MPSSAFGCLIPICVRPHLTMQTNTTSPLCPIIKSSVSGLQRDPSGYVPLNLFVLLVRKIPTKMWTFLSDLQCSRLITNPPNSLGSLLIAYNTTLSFLLDKHAPVITKFSSRKSKSNPWFTSTLRAFKSTVRHAENI